MRFILFMLMSLVGGFDPHLTNHINEYLKHKKKINKIVNVTKQLKEIIKKYDAK